ncbi:hypothetical protein BFL28_12445 [Sphingomonas turrisvirgatae]|uniref:Uncharacterized protein n=1 Tax=Sphingomonas turrisvirgatae TaxID=1888892 RepID=A0A1E3LZ29_9SPHN|nr:hypothetical protein BFL28_12445 [Sphingomonas turrisvirgatae]
MTAACAAPALQIQGVTDLSPQAFPRVLDRLLVLGGVPLSISYLRRPWSGRFELYIDGLSGMDAALISARLSAMPSVRAIRICHLAPV